MLNVAKLNEDNKYCNSRTALTSSLLQSGHILELCGLHILPHAFCRHTDPSNAEI